MNLSNERLWVDVVKKCKVGDQGKFLDTWRGRWFNEFNLESSWLNIRIFKVPGGWRVKQVPEKIHLPKEASCWCLYWISMKNAADVFNIFPIKSSKSGSAAAAIDSASIKISETNAHGYCFRPWLTHFPRYTATSWLFFFFVSQTIYQVKYDTLPSTARAWNILEHNRINWRNEWKIR